MVAIFSFFLGIALYAGQAAIAPQSLQAAPHSAGEWCAGLSTELRSVNLERCQGHPWKIEAISPKGHPIPSLRWGFPLADVSGSASKTAEWQNQKILVLGAIHGDEISSISMIFRWIDFLDRTKSDSFLRKNQYLFLPLINPDGFYAQPRTRTNSNGVDLNRNFSTKEWPENAYKFWKLKTASDPRRFPGKKAASELETQAVQKAIDEFKPDLIVSVHAPYCLVDHDGPIMFPSLKSPLPIRTLGAFPGSLGTYAGIERKIPVVTPELPNARQMPDAKSVEQLLLFILRSKF